MTDNLIYVKFNLCHSQADPDAIRPLIEKLRRKAIDLGFLGVSELFFHPSQADILSSEYGERFLMPDSEIVPTIPTAVCYFVQSLPDSFSKSGTSSPTSFDGIASAWDWVFCLKCCKVRGQTIHLQNP